MLFRVVVPTMHVGHRFENLKPSLGEAVSPQMSPVCDCLIGWSKNPWDFQQVGPSYKKEIQKAIAKWFPPSPISKSKLRGWLVSWFLSCFLQVSMNGGTSKWLNKNQGKSQSKMDDWGYPLVMTNIAIENGPVEIVDFPIKNGWIFPQLFWHNQRVPQMTQETSISTMVLTILELLCGFVLVAFQNSGLSDAKTRDVELARSQVF